MFTQVTQIYIITLQPMYTFTIVQNDFTAILIVHCFVLYDECDEINKQKWIAQFSSQILLLESDQNYVKYRSR